MLLTGPEGLGKRLAARAAAEAVGAHFVSIGGHELVATDGAEDKAMEAISTAFESAAAFGPTVMLLSGVDALGAPRGGAGGSWGVGDTAKGRRGRSLRPAPISCFRRSVSAASAAFPRAPHRPRPPLPSASQSANRTARLTPSVPSLRGASGSTVRTASPAAAPS